MVAACGGPVKFKFRSNLFKAVIHEALSSGLTGFCGGGGQLLGCRTESVGNVAVPCRKPQDPNTHAQGKKHPDQRGEPQS